MNIALQGGEKKYPANNIELSEEPALSSENVHKGFQDQEEALVNNEKLHKQVAEEPEESSTWWDKAQRFAEVICSRESTYRAALDVTGWELPAMIAAATRNIYNLAENLLTFCIAFSSIFLAPKCTELVTKIIGSFMLSEDEKKNIEYLMLLQMPELDSMEAFEKGRERIMQEEYNDTLFLTEIYKHKPDKAKYYLDKANAIKDFFSDFKPTPELLTKLKGIRQLTIQGQSLIEGGIWGALFRIIRWFRKNVLHQDMFTGAQGYLDEKTSKKIGNSAEYAGWQKIGSGLAMVASPIFNAIAMKLMKGREAKPDQEAVQNTDSISGEPSQTAPEKTQKSFYDKFLDICKNQLDLTHGKYPKLGLLFSFVQIPAIISRFSNAQGKYEIIENIMTIAGIVPSWWLGHRATNGVLAKMADKKLAKEFGVKEGILVEPEELKHKCPEPAKIQHILNRTASNKKLQKAARSEHAKTLYMGFGLHSLLVLGMRLVMNKITKTLVLKDAEKLTQES